MRSALIDTGIVVNVAEGLPNGYVACDDEVNIEWLYDGVDFTAPPPPPPEPVPTNMEKIDASDLLNDPVKLALLEVLIDLHGTDMVAFKALIEDKM